MRLLVILITTLWGAGAVFLVALVAERSQDAKLTATYLWGWPVVAVTLMLNEPVPLWLAAPAVVGFLPWLMAGPHLFALLKGLLPSGPGGMVGIPFLYWGWGAIGSVLLGLFLGRLL